MTDPTLADALDAALPQTQCTRCGYPDCRHYAQAMADGLAEINQCPPGGTEGVARLARLTGRAVIPINPDNGHEGPRQLAVIDEAWCIGCTLCLAACPVDAILGGPKRMHTVIEPLCTGCELCIPACPVDCISLVNASGSRTGWQAWSDAQAREAAERYDFHRHRAQRDEHERNERLAARARALSAPAAAAPASTPDAGTKESRIAAALARARRRQSP
ncbi:MAG: electron transport complex subunit RsxB [Rhizobacter sp.]|nr:electron transport complex subunit RsxB [Rhizobacter sp.]